MENENDLVITIREKGGEAFYRETVNVLSQYRALLRQPGRKLRDSFRILRVYVVICEVLFVLCAGLAVRNGVDGILIAAMLALLLAAVFGSAYRMNLSRLARKLSDDHSSSVLTFDGQGVELDHENAQTVRLAWGNVAFIRVFRESIGVLSKDGRGFVISIDRRYENEVIPWLKDRRPEVPLIPAQDRGPT